MKALFLSGFVSAILIAAPLFGATHNVSTPAQFQTALTTAQSNNEDDVINVAAGTYNITSTLVYLTASGDNGYTLTIQSAGAASTILDGGGSIQIMSITANGNLGGDVLIRGFTFRNGRIVGFPAVGGGLRVSTNSAAITLTGNTFTSNNAAGNGGGVFAGSGGSNSAIVTLTGNTFTTNNADNEFGGGAYAFSDSNSVILTGNTFTGNSAPLGGGANVYSESGSIIFTNNIFAGNISSNQGGGAWVESYDTGPVTFTNNTLYGNTAANYGGVYLYLYNDNVQANVYNNIFWTNVANSGGNDGDDLYVESDVDENGTGSAVALFNNDFSGSANFTSGQSEDLFITDIDNYTQGSNIQADPLFVNAGSGDFHLQGGSPAINVGNNSAPSLPSTDFGGNPRIISSIVDMGAFEYMAAVAIPTMNEWGMIIFMILAGFGSVYYLRRQKRTEV